MTTNFSLSLFLLQCAQAFLLLFFFHFTESGEKGTSIQLFDKHFTQVTLKMCINALISSPLDLPLNVLSREGR